MSLRQIMREQKLSNFNYKLTDFISEADDDEKVTKKDAFAGKTDAKVPKDKYWFVKPGEKPRDRVNSPGAGWKLADKDEAREAEETKKDIEAIDDELRDNINQEMGGLNLEPHPEDENSFVDKEGDEIFQIGSDGKIQPGGGIGKFKAPEGEPYADYIDDLNDRLHGDDEPEPKKKESKPKPKPKKKKKEKETVKDSPKDRKAIEKINEFLPESVREADPSIARALHYGYKKIPQKPPARAGEIWTPAPGNASSLFNETVSMIGAEILKENPGMSREDLKKEGITKN